MAVWIVSDRLTGLERHSHSGSKLVSLARADRILELGGTPHVGSKGKSDDNALADSPFTLFKTELIKKRLPSGPSSRQKAPSGVGVMVE